MTIWCLELCRILSRIIPNEFSIHKQNIDFIADITNNSIGHCLQKHFYLNGLIRPLIYSEESGGKKISSILQRDRLRLSEVKCVAWPNFFWLRENRPSSGTCNSPLSHGWRSFVCSCVILHHWMVKPLRGALCLRHLYIPQYRSCSSFTSPALTWQADRVKEMREFYKIPFEFSSKDRHVLEFLVTSLWLQEGSLDQQQCQDSGPPKTF